MQLVQAAHAEAESIDLAVTAVAWSVRRPHPHAGPDPDRHATDRGRPNRPGRRGLLQDLPQVRQQLPDEQHLVGPKVIYNGIQKYKINWLTCYKVRPEYVADHYGSCLTCIAVCPFTKPDAWWRRVGGTILKMTPIKARPPVVHALKWIDDTFWGEFPVPARQVPGVRHRPQGGRAQLHQSKLHRQPQGAAEDHPRRRRVLRPDQEADRRLRQAGLGMARRSRGLSRWRDDLSRLRGALQAPLRRLRGQDDPYWDDFINRPPNDVRNMITEIVAKAPEGQHLPDPV